MITGSCPRCEHTVIWVDGVSYDVLAPEGRDVVHACRLHGTTMTEPAILMPFCYVCGKTLAVGAVEAWCSDCQDKDEAETLAEMETWVFSLRLAGMGPT